MKMSSLTSTTSAVILAMITKPIGSKFPENFRQADTRYDRRYVSHYHRLVTGSHILHFNSHFPGEPGYACSLSFHFNGHSPGEPALAGVY